MKLTLIKAHTPENNYDGYDPHRHWELVNMPVADYLTRVVEKGLVYPGKDMADLILNPWRLPWIRDNVKLVGYDYMELVDQKYYHLYAFDNLHDGIDGQPVEDGPGTFVQQVQSGYISPITGHHATADIYEVEIEEGGDNMPEIKPLEPWQNQAGTDALDALSAAKIVSNPDDRKKTLDQPVKQWELYVLLERIRAGAVVKQGK